jgi:acetylornithine deacetylase/succinyl-diaminopimelate desuccinylase family protein
MDKNKMTKEVDRYIEDHREDILTTLKKYINFRSINTEQLLEGEGTEIVECQKWISSELEKIGYFDKIDYYEKEKGRPNVVGVKKGNGDGRSLMFNTHSDVVTVSEEQKEQWTTLAPFDGGVEDGKVWGRGTSDMKAGGTAMIYAARALADLNIKLKGDLLLSFVDGEESGRADIGIFTLLDKGYSADFSIMGEPTNLEHIYHKTKGEIYLDIKMQGDSTHICNRYKTIWPQKTRENQVGVNAIDKMVKLINAFNELERSWGLDYYDPSMDPGSTTVTVSMIKGGESFSAQAGECEMTIASMFAPQLSVADIKMQLMDTIDYISDHDHWLKNHRPEVKLPFPPKEPLNVDKNDEAVKTLSASYQQVLESPPKVGPGFFVGDANYLFEKGQKCVYFGPGNANFGIHGTNEYVPVEQVINAAKVYAVMAINWCGTV